MSPPTGWKVNEDPANLSEDEPQCVWEPDGCTDFTVAIRLNAGIVPRHSTGLVLVVSQFRLFCFPPTRVSPALLTCDAVG